MNKYIVYYLIVINIVGFLAFYLDKQKAIHGKWRIPERTLFLFGILGGSIGCLLGMFTFHHKTRKWYFRLGMPFILIVQLLIIYFLKENGLS